MHNFSTTTSLWLVHCSVGAETKKKQTKICEVGHSSISDSDVLERDFQFEDEDGCTFNIADTALSRTSESSKR